MHKRPSEDPRDVFSNDMYTTGGETGNFLVDHALAIYCTSQMGKFIMELADFASFDVSQMFHNMRKFMQEGLVEGIDATGYTGIWSAYLKKGEGDIPMDLVEKVVSTWEVTLKDIAIKLTGEGVAKDAKFKLPNGKILTLDMLQSGELMTLAINNVTNDCNFRDFISELKKRPISEQYELISVLLQGDDYLGIWGIEPSTFTAEAAKEFLELRVARSAENGLTIKKSKTGFSVMRSEYLKKEFILGMFIPLLHIQTGSTERVEKPPHPVEWIRSFGSTISTIIGRGGAHNLHSCYHFLTWILQGNIKIHPKSSPVKMLQNRPKIYYFPIAGYFTPIQMKGIGNIPWCMHGASKDGIIAMYCKKYPEMEKAVNIASTVLDVSYEGIRRSILDSIIRGNTEPTNIMKPGMDFVNNVLMPEFKRKNAAIAMSKLINLERDHKVNISLGQYAYFKTPERMIGNAVKQAGSYLKLSDSDKSKGGIYSLEKALKREITADVRSKFDWIFVPKYAEGLVDNNDSLGVDYIEYILDKNSEISFQPCLEKLSKNLLLMLGPNTDAGVYSINVANLLNKLRRDRLFPADIKSETILEFLIRPGIFGFPDRMSWVLIAMGADPGVANEVASEFALKANRISMQQIVQSFSLADQFLPSLGVNREWVNKNIYVDGTLPKDIQDAYNNLLALFVIVDGFQNSNWRKQRVILTEGDHNKITLSLYGNANRKTVNENFDARYGFKVDDIIGDYF